MNYLRSERSEMSNDVRFVNVRNLKDQVRDILESAYYLGSWYIVTNHGRPVAQIVSPKSISMPGAAEISVTDVRLKTRELLESVYFHGQSYLILTYGKAMAIMCPVQEGIAANALDQVASFEN